MCGVSVPAPSAQVQPVGFSFGAVLLLLELPPAPPLLELPPEPLPALPPVAVVPPLALTPPEPAEPPLPPLL